MFKKLALKKWSKWLMISASSAVMAGMVAMPVSADELTDALKAVYENNPRLKAQREQLKALDESVAQAVSGWRPSVIGNYSKGRERTSLNGADWNYSDPKSRQLVVEQPIFNGGETWSRIKSTKSQVKSGREQLRAFEQQLMLETITAYMDVYQSQAVLDLSTKNVDVLKKQLKASQDRFAVGEVTRTDVAQSEARLSAAESERITADGALESARASFKRITGFDSPAQVPLPGLLAPLPTTKDEAVQQALTLNPGLIAAKHQEKAADYNVNANISTLLPDVSLQGRMSRSEETGNTGNQDFDNDSILLNVSVPFYQTGSEYAAIRESRNQLQRSKYDLSDARDAAVEASTRAWEQYDAANSAIQSRLDAIRAAEIALEGVRQEQQFGARTTLDVLDAEQELFVARVNLVRAQREATLAANNLLVSVGRLTAEGVSLQSPIYNPKEHYDDVKYKFIGF